MLIKRFRRFFRPFEHFRRFYRQFEAFFAFWRRENWGVRNTDALFCARLNFRAFKKQKELQTCGKPYENACYASYIYDVYVPTSFTALVIISWVETLSLLHAFSKYFYLSWFQHKLSAVLNLFISKANKDLLLGTGAENCNQL